MIQTSIYPDRELRKQLELICKKENRSLNNLIIRILKKYVEAKKHD